MDSECKQSIKHLDSIASSLERIASCLEAMGTQRIPLETPVIHVRSETTSHSAINESPSSELESDAALLHNDADYSALAGALLQKGITLEDVAPAEAGGEQLDRIAYFMGSRYELVKPFLDRLKRSLSTSRVFTMYLKGEPQETVASITQLADNLWKMAYLSEYRYLRSPKFQLYACVQDDGDVENFFTGDWFERYVRVVAEGIMNEVPTSNRADRFSMFSNVKVALDGRDQFELDHVVLANEKLYWLECKSGKDINRYIKKYSDIADRYEFDHERSFLILANDDTLNLEFLNTTSGIRIVEIGDFEEAFREVFLSDLSEPRVVSDAMPVNTQDGCFSIHENPNLERIRRMIKSELAALESRLLEAIEDEEARLRSSRTCQTKQEPGEIVSPVEREMNPESVTD